MRGATPLSLPAMAMSKNGITHAIVPVKTLDRAKSRLAGALTPAARRALVLEMLERVLAALQHPAAQVTMVWVISGDPQALQVAASCGAYPLVEEVPDLNAALEQARRVALSHGAEALLVVPADVPLVLPAEIGALVAALATSDIVLVPDAAGLGTNALGLRREAELPFRFGGESAALHLAAATERGLRTCRLPLASFALDVDQPAGLASYRSRVPAEPVPATAAQRSAASHGERRGP